MTLLSVILVKVNTYHIHITGIVQGVGFRPYVYQLAKQYGLYGWINNTSDGVHIEINANEKAAELFYNQLIDQPPLLANITNSSFKQVDSVAYSDFSIIESESQASPNLPLTPDFALCEECRQDIDDQTNRRNGYAFTTCTNCGPRYSIINKMPYDRPLTTMASFEQCPTCKAEYNDPLNRRHYSQTNSCYDCGISLFTDDENNIISVEQIAYLLNQGKIIAIKGIGGFLLMCDASDPKVINKLRERKNRPSKPFAVMYPSLDQIKKEYKVNEEAAKWLSNEVSPIILLEPKTKHLSIDIESI
ncbi:MAG: acylphosphatase, partial [Bacteroidota bacterium]